MLQQINGGIEKYSNMARLAMYLARLATHVVSRLSTIHTIDNIDAAQPPEDKSLLLSGWTDWPCHGPIRHKFQLTFNGHIGPI